MIRIFMKHESHSTIWPAAVLVAAFGVGAPGIAAAAQATIYSFTIGADGGHPRSGLIMDGTGALYGTTAAGGNRTVCFQAPGCGVVFRLVPPTGQSAAVETAIYTFSGGSDGTTPVGGLLMDKAGSLYGTTSQGGAGGYGVVFKLTPPGSGDGAWTETTLFSFAGGKDGGTPLGSLVADASGALYGTTQNGGAGGFGVVFRLTPGKNGSWTDRVLHHFRGSRDGGAPVAGLVMDEAGTLYGSTPGYGMYDFGVAFALSPIDAGAKRWKETVLHAFTNGGDGSYPMGSFLLAKDGGLFGTTSNMGTNAAGVGTVFKLTRPDSGKTRWHAHVLFDFNGFLSTASHPVGQLAIDRAGALYGTSVAGGNGQMGVLFKLENTAGDGPWTESEPDMFYGNGSDGAQPMGGVTVDKAGTLFGTTYIGGAYRYGAVFEVTQ
jgi:uncharacterized repeat protein (TIGR03803 family)